MISRINAGVVLSQIQYSSTLLNTGVLTGLVSHAADVVLLPQKQVHLLWGLFLERHELLARDPLLLHPSGASLNYFGHCDFVSNLN